MLDNRRLSLGTLLRIYWPGISVTWGLIFVETMLLAALPLLLGQSITRLTEITDRINMDCEGNEIDPSAK